MKGNLGGSLSARAVGGGCVGCVRLWMREGWGGSVWLVVGRGGDLGVGRRRGMEWRGGIGLGGLGGCLDFLGWRVFVGGVYRFVRG